MADNNKPATAPVAASPKPSRFHLPKLKLFARKSAATPVEPTVAKPDEPVTPEAVINSLDSQIEIHAQSQESRLQEKMSDHMGSVHKHEFLTLKLNVQKILLILGLIILVLWLLPVFKVVNDRRMSTTTPSATPLPSSLSVKIKIKGTKDSRTQMEGVVKQLQSLGYLNIDQEIVESLEDNVGIYVKETHKTIADQLIIDLKDLLPMTASESANLDNESDVDLVIVAK